MSKNNKYIPKKKNKENFNINIYSNKQNNEEDSKINIYSNKQNNKKSKKKKIIIISICVLFFILVLTKVFAVIFNFKYKEIDRDDLGINEEYLSEEFNDILNIALLGVDNNGTSDAIMILNVNPKNEISKIKLVSIARDSLVKVYPKNKSPFKTKINESFNYGGEETLIRTLNKNFGLNIREFVAVKMDGLAIVLQKLDGIDLEITKDEQNQINGIINTTKNLKKICNKYVKDYGKVHLNGVQAVAFSRIRKVPTKDGLTDDFGRNKRQREVILKTFEKVKTMPKSKIFSLIEPSLNYVETSFKISKIFSLFKEITSKNYRIEQTSIPYRKAPLDPDYKIENNGVLKSTVFYDVKYAGKMIKAFLFKDVRPEDFFEENPPLASQAFKNNSQKKHKLQHQPKF